MLMLVRTRVLPPAAPRMLAGGACGVPAFGVTRYLNKDLGAATCVSFMLSVFCLGYGWHNGVKNFSVVKRLG